MATDAIVFAPGALDAHTRGSRCSPPGFSTVSYETLYRFIRSGLLRWRATTKAGVRGESPGGDCGVQASSGPETSSRPSRPERRTLRVSPLRPARNAASRHTDLHERSLVQRCVFVCFRVPPQAAFCVPARRRSPEGRRRRADAGETPSQAGCRQVPAGLAEPILRSARVRGRASARRHRALRFYPFSALLRRMDLVSLWRFRRIRPGTVRSLTLAGTALRDATVRRRAAQSTRHRAEADRVIRGGQNPR